MISTAPIADTTPVRTDAQRVTAANTKKRSQHIKVFHAVVQHTEQFRVQPIEIGKYEPKAARNTGGSSRPAFLPTKSDYICDIDLAARRVLTDAHDREHYRQVVEEGRIPLERAAMLLPDVWESIASTVGKYWMELNFLATQDYFNLSTQQIKEKKATLDALR